MRNFKRRIRPYGGSQPVPDHDNRLRYAVEKRTDFWAKKWLKDDYLAASMFFEIDESDVAYIRRGAGLAYNFIGQRCKGVVLRRRRHQITVRCKKEIHTVTLYASRSDWGRYLDRLAKRHLKILHKALIAMRPEVKEAAAACLERLKINPRPNCTETKFVYDLASEMQYRNLTENEQRFIYKYFEILKTAFNVTFLH